MKNYVQEGKIMPHTPGADVESGELRQVGTLVGVATGKILSGVEGELSLVGVIKVPNPDSVVFTQGLAVGYVVASHKLIASGGGDFDIGAAFKASSGALDVEVLLPLGPA